MKQCLGRVVGIDLNDYACALARAINAEWSRNPLVVEAVAPFGAYLCREPQLESLPIGVVVGLRPATRRARFGVLVCGTGIGISIAANRHPGIRCALIHDVTGARLTRQHNDANIIALGARMTGAEVAQDALATFLATPSKGVVSQISTIRSISFSPR